MRNRRCFYCRSTIAKKGLIVDNVSTECVLAEEWMRKILIVEDDGIVARHIQNSLVRLGYAVIGAVASGEKACL